MRLGIRVLREEAYNRQVLERLGVPLTAIELLDRPVLNTVPRDDSSTRR